MSRIIRRSQSSDNTPSHSVASDSQQVQLLKDPNVVVNNVHNIVDNAEMRQLLSRLERLELEVKDQIRLIEQSLSGKTVTRAELKRTLSRLRGSLQYPGHA